MQLGRYKKGCFIRGLALVVALTLLLPRAPQILETVGELLIPRPMRAAEAVAEAVAAPIVEAVVKRVAAAGDPLEILMGIAAIIAPIAAAMAQVAAAKEKANADKYIANKSAEAAITQTKIQSDTTKELAENQRVVAEQNTKATQELAQKQQDASTQRLQMQLAALESEREKASAERAEIRAIEEKRNQEAVALAQETAEKNLKLAKLAMYQQTVQNGLTPTATNSGARLSTTNIASGRGQPAGGSSSIQSQIQNSGNSNPVALGVMESQGGSNTSIQRMPASGSTALGVMPSASRGVSSEAIVVGEGSQTDNRKPTPASTELASASLLSSVKTDFARNFGASGMLNPILPKSYATARMRGVAPQPTLLRSSTGRGLSIALQSNRGVVGGSTRGLRQRIAGNQPQNSGLRDFAQAIDRNAGNPHVGYGGHGGGGAHGLRGPSLGRVNNGYGITQYSLGSSRGRGSAIQD